MASSYEDQDVQTVLKTYAQKLIVVKIVQFYIKISPSQVQGSNTSMEGPGRYREVGGDDRNNSVLTAPLNSFMVPSYDQQKRKSSRVSIKV